MNLAKDGLLQILLILERAISEGFARTRHTLVAFFDVKKAYDRVCRRIVLDITFSDGK
jgi:hypothetical protein